MTPAEEATLERESLVLFLACIKHDGIKKTAILAAWMQGTEHNLVARPDRLRRARNVLGPSWLEKNWRKL